MYCFFFFFNDTATTEIYTLSLHDALPIWGGGGLVHSDTKQLIAIKNRAYSYLNIWSTARYVLGRNTLVANICDAAEVP